MTNQLWDDSVAAVEPQTAGPDWLDQFQCTNALVKPCAAGGRAAPAARSALEGLDPAEADVRQILTTPIDDLPTTLRGVRELLEACRDDPARFNTEVLGRELWAKQFEICSMVARNPITIVPAGRAVGKSYLLAGLALWWLYTRPNSLVITTGPGLRQIVSVLWKEIRLALRVQFKDGRRVGPRLNLGFHRMTTGYSSPQRLEVQQGTGWGALGFSAHCQEGFSGQHAGELLVIVDEASGIDQEIWSSIHGLAASRMVVAGNPIRYDCHFRELYERAAAGSAALGAVSISTLESPDAAKEESPVGMASASFLRNMREIHGDASSWWRANILGQFPNQERVRFIPLAWLDAGAGDSVRDDPLWRDYPASVTFMGIDIGGGVGGDRSVIVVRNDKQILEIFASEWHGVLDDARHRLEPEVVRLKKKWKVEGDKIVYDQAGIGRNFGEYLKRHGVEGAVGTFGGGKGGKLYCNRRTANAFMFRKRVDPHGKDYVPFYVGGIGLWPALRQELSEVHQPGTEIDDGQIKQALESKDALAARLKRSPDLLDAFLMSFTFRV